MSDDMTAPTSYANSGSKTNVRLLPSATAGIATTPAHRARSDHRSAGEQHTGQVRIAYRLRAAYRERLLYVHGLGWHCWDGTRWAADDSGTAKRAVLDVLRCSLADSLGDKRLQQDVRRCESDSGINGVLGIAAALVPFAAAARDLDADPYLLNTANGTLDLRTLTVSPHRPADRITKVCNGAYDPDVESPLWTAFLTRVLPGDSVREFLQRLVGVALLGSVREHVPPDPDRRRRKRQGHLLRSRPAHAR